MGNQGITSAFLAFLITAATTLISLFNQEDVHSFADVSEVAYAAALLGAIVAGANTYKARMSQTPVKKVRPGVPK